MTTRPDPFDGARDATHDAERDAQAFDAAARGAHADALQHVSARVQAQLQQRRRAALAGQSPAAQPLRQRTGPLLALGGTAALALAIGLRFAGGRVDTPATPSVATQANGERANDASATIATRTPDSATAMTTGANDEPNAAAQIDASPREAIVASDPSIDPNRDSTDASLREIDALLADIVGDDGVNDDALLAANDDDELLAGLEENPDLYLWLGSDESQADAVESL